MSSCKGLAENVCGTQEDCSVVVRGKTTYCRSKPKRKGVAVVAAPAAPAPMPAPMPTPVPSPSPVIMPTPVPSPSPVIMPSPVSSLPPTPSSSSESEQESAEDSAEDSAEESEIDSAEESEIDSAEESEIESAQDSQEEDSEEEEESEIESEEEESQEEAIQACSDNEFSKECNKIKLRKELKEGLDESENTYLYPNLNDPNFNIKIATKTEFNDTKYDGTIHANVKQQAEKLSKADFELSPHQAFIKNFLSFQTPYNSLLLYHGLGSGKTCSAIGVSEEMRDYLKQMNHSKRIIIVASANVQENFRLQLFDERKLKEENGVWNITNCIGNKLLREINATNLTREKIISEINAIITNSYLFVGYIEFANFILRKAGSGNAKSQKERLKREFDNRLIIIDEVHNIRVTDTNEKIKLVATNLELLVKSADNLRLLLLSATPMFNTYEEIIWLLNLMNINDRRSTIEEKDIFDSAGNFIEGGKQKLIQKATGYVSFVRGENPYTFPYRVYPNTFSLENTFFNKRNKYPTIQMNGDEIAHSDRLKRINVYLGKIGSYQSLAYNYIKKKLGNKKDALAITFGYALLQRPLECLIMTYPHDELTAETVAVAVADDASISSPEVSPVSSLPESSEESSSASSEVVAQEEEPAISEEEAKEEEEEPAISEEEVKEEEEEPEISEEEEVKEEEEPEISEEVKEEEEPVIKESSSVSSPVVSSVSSLPSPLSSASPVVSSVASLSPVASPSPVPSPSPIASLSPLEELESFSPEEELPEEKEEEEAPESTNSPLEEEEKESISPLESASASASISPLESVSASASVSPEDSTSSITSQKGGALNMEELVGKQGLERVMDFKNYSNYEYNPRIEAKYGRIFSLDEIGKYSFKIESIMKSIIQSKGIILIYSQYIDAGLIPMALALEEEGFSKFDGKSLLKNKRPSPSPSAKPAKYAMITGNAILSPDNVSLVKEITDKKNKHGERIKVILVSRAGTEGIDLKFIRQVHILEPWYNMNRIEQIIGRAVRNFSHKDLPFEERNVQIFLHGTLLENEEEEAIDLYVYRIAERKSIQIGKVSRILKETAVDCIINHSQTNFTQDIMNDKIEGNITQYLSNGMEILDFKIGDQPYSAACDYMKNCHYNCTPSVEIDEYNLNEDTYNEKFIMINSERINQRIKMLFKESFFYIKHTLFDLIDIPKKYPLVQKYAALTFMIDNSEPIIDKYGRPGHLINIGDYYLFQPKELMNHHASLFERSVPIQYKHKSIHFTIKHDLTKQVIDKRNIMAEQPQEENSTFTLLKYIYDSFLTYKRDPNQKVPKDVPDVWYLYYGIIMNKIRMPELADLLKIQPVISADTMTEYFIEHMFDVLQFKEKYAVLNYVYSLEQVEEGTFEMLAKEYFFRHSLTIARKSRKPITVILLHDNMKPKEKDIVFTLQTNVWIETGLEEKREILKSPEAIKWQIDRGELGNIVGFIGYESKNKFMVFKTKDTTSKRNSGARCDQAIKSIKVDNLNKILGGGGPETFNKQNTKNLSGDEICILQEVLLRYYNSIRKNGKRWFIPSDIALYNDF